MFFGLSKIFWVLIQPLNTLCLLALIGLLLRLKWKALGQGVMNTALVLILVLGFIPFGPYLLGKLEWRYPPIRQTPIDLDGIIVLGGAFETHLSESSGRIEANDQIERFFCAVELAKANPKARLVFSGGSGDVLHPEAREADDARTFFDMMGLSDRQIVYEDKSRNTYENVLYSKGLLNPLPSEKWVVTTSGYHMPRTIGIFTKAEWPVMPFPCDYKTDGTFHLFDRLPSVSGNFYALNLFLKETTGAVVYYLTGKSAFIFPPDEIPESP
jgi:uncharacterized SAM-binding protein YcdF (DUF218 family)